MSLLLRSEKYKIIRTCICVVYLGLQVHSQIPIQLNIWDFVYPTCINHKNNSAICMCVNIIQYVHTDLYPRLKLIALRKLWQGHQWKEVKGKKLLLRYLIMFCFLIWALGSLVCSICENASNCPFMIHTHLYTFIIYQLKSLKW